MIPNIQQYMKLKYGNLPTVEVTKEEFIALLVSKGKTKEQAEFQIKFGQQLGSDSMMIDDMRYKIQLD